jgi:glycosyltransferase involved in cell wall biosynthesis
MCRLCVTCEQRNKKVNRAERRDKKRASGSISGTGASIRNVGVPSAGRILWNSNAPWAATGYGQQTAQVTTRLKKENYEVAIASNYGLEASSTVWNTPHGEIPVYPRGMEMYSNDVIPAHMHDWSSRETDVPNLLITLYDVWVFKGSKWDDWKVASWVPVDHLPAPAEVVAWCAKPNVTPIAMSQFGKSMLENAGLETEYVPHALEKTFKPTDRIQTADGDFITARDFIKVPEDKFVVGMNAANKGIVPNRKAFGENLLAFSMFAQNHKDAVLYLHTDFTGSGGGINLADLIKAVGISKDQVKFVDPYLYRSSLNSEVVAATYTAMDVLLAVSMGEGFGIPTIEAQACGTRVIVSDFAASSELVGEGWLVEGQPYWDPMQRSFFHTPSVPSIVDALEKAYNKGRSRSTQAIEFAKLYEADTVFENYWKPVLSKLLTR